MIGGGVSKLDVTNSSLHPLELEILCKALADTDYEVSGIVVVSCRVMSCRGMSRRVVWCRVVSCRVVACLVVSCRVALSRSLLFVVCCESVFCC